MVMFFLERMVIAVIALFISGLCTGWMLSYDNFVPYRSRSRSRPPHQHQGGKQQWGQIRHVQGQQGEGGQGEGEDRDQSGRQTGAGNNQPPCVALRCS